MRKGELKPAGDKRYFDPRTKLLLLLLCIVSSVMAPSLLYELGLVLLVMLFGVICKRVRYSLLGAAGYGLIYALTLYTLHFMEGNLQTTFMASLGLFHKVYPCGMAAGVMLATTKVSEFMAAMNRLHVPGKIVIPLAVMLRYIPVVREDWSFIKDAMRMRDVGFSFRGMAVHPVRTMECVYVPMMMSASKAADELAIASVTRGIENPKPRTCLTLIRFRMADLLALLPFLVYFAFSFYR